MIFSQSEMLQTSCFLHFEVNVFITKPKKNGSYKLWLKDRPAYKNTNAFWRGKTFFSRRKMFELSMIAEIVVSEFEGNKWP